MLVAINTNNKLIVFISFKFYVLSTLFGFQLLHLFLSAPKRIAPNGQGFKQLGHALPSSLATAAE